MFPLNIKFDSGRIVPVITSISLYFWIDLYFFFNLKSKFDLTGKIFEGVSFINSIFPSLTLSLVSISFSFAFFSCLSFPNDKLIFSLTLSLNELFFLNSSSKISFLIISFSFLFTQFGLI